MSTPDDAYLASLREITPKGSEVPVYVDPTPPVRDRTTPLPSPDEMMAAEQKVRDSAIAKLMGGKKLTEAEARVIVGLPASSA